MQMGAAGGVSATAAAAAPSYALKYTYDQTTGELKYEAFTSGLAPSDRVLGLTI